MCLIAVCVCVCGQSKVCFIALIEVWLLSGERHYIPLLSQANKTMSHALFSMITTGLTPEQLDLKRQNKMVC